MLKQISPSTLLALIAVALSGCASLSNELNLEDPYQSKSAHQILLDEVESYPNTTAQDTRVDFEALKLITPEMREAIDALFPSRDAVLDINAASRIADWMIDPNGLGMSYDINANFTPAQAFTEKRANCLSFTLLLRQLASLSDITIEINEVDIPSNWGMNIEENIVFYRHVNGIRLRGPRRQVFDLALDQFRFDYPQRRISEAHAYAQLISNKAIDALSKTDYETAEHLIKSALAEYPYDPNLWVNFGVISERLGNRNKAAGIYRLALGIDGATLVAITNLARVYEQSGRLSESKKLQRDAEHIRAKNPYHQYFLAKESLDAGNARAARKHINKALQMHNKDARFYELRSRTWQLSERLPKALKDMQKAYNLSLQDEERFHYRSKAVYIATQLNKQHKQENARKLQTIINLQ